MPPGEVPRLLGPSPPSISQLFAGVCAARARALRHEAVAGPIAVLSCLLPGPQVLLYVALWIILPAE
jgi:phage shock protein PspC (stress-responsive transcriptional regulator)